MQKRRKFVKKNDLLERVQAESMDLQVVKAYESYVMAQIWFSDQGIEVVRCEQKKAIESLIPGSLHYYHLYFTDLSKQKDFDQLSAEEKELYSKFKVKFGESTEFLEVETAFQVVRKLEKLPQKVDEMTDDQDIQTFISIVDYIDTQINEEVVQTQYEKPDFMNDEAVKEGENKKDDPNNDEEMQEKQDEQDSSEQIEESDEEKKSFDCSEFFSKEKMIQRLDEEIKSNCLDKEYDNWLQTDSDASFGDFNYKNHLSVINDYDWKKCSPQFVCGIAYRLVTDYNDNWKNLSLHEIDNESFFDQMCEGIKRFYGYINDQEMAEEKDMLMDNDLANQIIQSELLEDMTLAQLDMINKKLQALGVNIKSEKNYVQAYFQKQFNEELSFEYNANLSNEDKWKNLENMYQFAKIHDLSIELVSYLLDQLIGLCLKLNRVREDLFKEFIKQPKVEHMYFKRETVSNKSKQINDGWFHWTYSYLEHIRINPINLNTSIDVSSYDPIGSLLKIICQQNKGSLSDYREFFKEEYLKGIEKETLVYQSDKGLIDLEDIINIEEYKKIQNEVIIKFKETNQEKYKVDDTVKIALELKNIPELVIKVYEFNTETYYRRNLKPINTAIDLQGLEPSFIKKETEIFKGVSKNKIISHEITFEQLTGKIGLFIIEFQGNGKQARVIIKKGSLSLVHRTAKGGHIAYIIDENTNICMSDDGQTGVIIDSIFYRTDVSKNGAIFIPYTKNNAPKQYDIILVSKGFAELTKFTVNKEEYEFHAHIHMNSETFIAGQKATIIITPRLTLNKRPVSISHLKRVNLDVNISQGPAYASNQGFHDLKFKDGEDFVYEVVVPPHAENIWVRLSGYVFNSLLNSNQSVGNPNKGFKIKKVETKPTSLHYDLFLRQVGLDHYMYLFGKNGEPLKKCAAKITAKHHDTLVPYQRTIYFDETGRIKLGQLKGISKIKANIKGPKDLKSKKKWKISNEQYLGTFLNTIKQESDTWSEPIMTLNVMKGETINLPISYNGSIDNLSGYYLSLIKYSDQQVIANLRDKIKIQPSKSGAYNQILIEDLEPGNYKLKLNISSNQNQSIEINVHSGVYWQGNFILSNNKLFEYTPPSKTVRIDGLVQEQVQGQDDTYTISAQLENFTEKSRVHLLATQFVDSDPNQFINNFNELCKSKHDSVMHNLFSEWTNYYYDGKLMADEILYVLNRKQQESLMGNLLNQPTILMNKQFVRNTVQVDEILNKGEDFKEGELSRLRMVERNC